MSDDVVAAPGHELLLALAGWVDDDLLAIGRELVAVGEEVGALELVVASLAAARTALPHPVRDGLADAAGRRLGADLARLVPPGAALPDRTPHVFDADAGDPEVTTRIGEVVAGLTAVGRSGSRPSLTWRLTPAGAAPGPLPHPVVLLSLDDPAVAEVLSYQVGAALARAGIPASVEAFGDGAPLPPYHRAALAAARPFSRPAPSPGDDLAAATPTVATVTGPHGGLHDTDDPVAPDPFSARPVPAGGSEVGVGDTAPRLDAVGGSAPPPAPDPSSAPGTPSAPGRAVFPDAPLPPVEGRWSGLDADGPAAAGPGPGGGDRPGSVGDGSAGDDARGVVGSADGSPAEGYRDDERREDAHRADVPDAGGAGTTPPSTPGTPDRTVDGIAGVDPARFDPARNAVDRTVHGGNGIPVAGRAPTTADDPVPAIPDAVAVRTEPPRPGPSPDRERSTASNGHPSPRPAPRRLPRPTPAADPGAPEDPAARAVDGYATAGATAPDPVAALPDPADEREWDRQWSTGSWSMPADPDIEPATSPTPTTPPPARVPSPTRRTSGDAAPADATVRPRHRLDAPEVAHEVFATPEPDGLSSEDVLDSRLTPNEQELLRRLQQELAARERGSAESPRNGAAQPDAD